MSDQTLEPIEFTQFLLPHGQRRQTLIARPKAIAEKATAVRDAGGRFEIEILSNGIISMEVVHNEDSLSMKLCQNDRSVPDAVDELVIESHEALFPEAK